jgi:hypothetical protein
MREAGRIRLRPILMTSVATIFGALPIALGLGAGAGSRRPLGYAIIGGMVVSTVITLFVVPAVFVVLDRLRGRVAVAAATAGSGGRAVQTALVVALLAVGALVFPAALAAQSRDDRVAVVTLVEARRRALAVDPAAVAARGDVAAAAWERRAALADLLTPHVTAGTSYIRFSDPFFNFGTGAISPNATSATVEASYAVLGSGKVAGYRRSRASVASG